MKTLWLFVAVVSLWSAEYVPIAAGQAKLVCYFGSWSKYRPDIGMFDVKDIDPNLCTHLIFGFSALNETTNEMVAYDAWNELDKNEPGGFYGAYKQFTNLKQKNPALKVLLAIGGWNEGSEKYSKMAATSATRTKFVNSVIPFLLKYKFDGLDFDWEYPGTRGGDHLVDKQNFIELIRQLKQAFTPYGYILTAAVSPGKTNIDIAYNIPALSSILDQIHLMAYDYHGAWEDFTGLNSPLYGNPKYDVANESTLNVDFSVNYWLQQGADLKKLIVGMPTYGRGFLLDNPSVNGLRAPASLPIDEGPYTRLNGTWSYMEICRKLKDEPGWQVCRDNCFQAPYAFSGKQWIGYDDVQSITLKANYARSMNVGGALVWSIDQDDFTGYCNGVASPLTRKIKEIMNGPMTTKPAACSNIPLPTTCQDLTTTSSTTTSTSTSTTRPTTTSTTTTTTTSTTSKPPTTPSTTTSTTMRPTTPSTTSTTPSTTSTTKTSTPTSTRVSITTSKGATPIVIVCDGSPESYVNGCIDDPQNSQCEKARDSLLPHPTDSTRFLYCVKNHPLFPNAWVIYTSRCPSRLLFNTHCNVCAFTMLAQEC